MFAAEKFAYDTRRFNFRERVQSIFKINYSPEAIHRLCETAPQTTFDEDTKTFFQRTFYSSAEYDSFRDLYYEFVRENIAPLFPGETALVVQKDPGFRVCPVGNTALGIRSGESVVGPIGMHTDGDYNHPPEEVNFILAITEMWETNSVYFESEPGKGDFAPLKLHWNQFIKIYANKLRHYNLLNTSGQSRVSLDFRIIPFSKYNPSTEGVSVHSHRRFLIGDYFIKMDL